MGDAESDEHLRLFKCLIDTGSLVLRNTIMIKLLSNNPINFVQYLKNRKHQFYHQFEKRKWKKCCKFSIHIPRSCVFDGSMDKKIFNKMYSQTSIQDKRDCLDRFEIKAGITLDILDLSDLYFLLWSSKSLSAQEELSLKKIMSIRSAICHPSSSHSYSIVELEGYWSDLENAVLLLAEPKCYRDIVEMQIKTLQNCKLNAIESEKIIRAIQQQALPEVANGSENCLTNENKTNHLCLKIKEIQKIGSRTMKKCRNQIVTKVQNEGMKTRLQTKRDRNFLDKRLKDNEKKFLKKVSSNKRRIDELTRLTYKERKQSSKRFIFMKKQHTENRKKDRRLMKRNKKQIEDKVQNEGIKTRLQTTINRGILDNNLKETETRVCQTVAQSYKQLEIKIEEKAIESRRYTNSQVKYLKNEVKELMGLLKNEKGLKEELADAQEINITRKLDQTCLTGDKEKTVNKTVPPKTDDKEAASKKQRFEVIVKHVNSVILKVKATPGIYEGVKNLKSLLRKLVQNEPMAGKIDPEIEDTVTVALSFNSTLTKDVFDCISEWSSNRANTIANLKQVEEKLDQAAEKIRKLKQGKKIAVTVVIIGAISGGYTLGLAGGVSTIGLAAWEQYCEEIALAKAHKSIEKDKIETANFLAYVKSKAEGGNLKERVIAEDILKNFPNGILTFKYTFTDLLKRLFISDSVSVSSAKERISIIRQDLENEEKRMQKLGQKGRSSRCNKKRKLADDK